MSKENTPKEKDQPMKSVDLKSLPSTAEQTPAPEKAAEEKLKIKVQCPKLKDHPGMYRAGLFFKQGETTEVEVNLEQLELIQSDDRLSIIQG